MDGVTVNDLVNLVNVGELKTNGQHTVFVTAQPDASQLDHYQWNVYDQHGKQSRRLLSVGQHPSLTLSYRDPKQLYYSTTDHKTKMTRLHQFNLTTLSEERQFIVDGYELKVEQELNAHELLLSGAYQLSKPTTGPWHEVKEVPYWSNDEGQINGVRHHLWKFNLATQLLTDLVPPTFDVANFWYQGGRLLITGVSYQNSRAFKDGLYEYDFSHHALVDLISPGQYRFDDVAILNHR